MKLRNWMKTSIEYNKLKTELQDIKQKYKVTRAKLWSAVSKIPSLSVDYTRLEKKEKWNNFTSTM